MEEERQVEERLLSEAPKNLKIYVGRAGEVQPPSTATGRDFTGDRHPTDGEHIAGRARLPGCGVAIWEDAAGGEVTPSTESEEAAENLRERSARRQACGPEEIPNSEQELAHLELRDSLEIGPNWWWRWLWPSLATTWFGHGQADFGHRPFRFWPQP